MENNEAKNTTVVEKPKKSKKEIKTWKGLIIIGVIGVIIIGTIYLLCFNQVDNKKKENKPTETPQKTNATKTPSPSPKEEELSVIDSEVQRLYGYIKGTIIQGRMMHGSEGPLTNKVLASEFTDIEKHQIAYRLINDAEKQLSECSKYPESISYYHDQTIDGRNYVCSLGVQDMQEVAPNGCGLEDTEYRKYDDRKNKTYTISETVMKGKVEIIFGENSYHPTSFNVKENLMYDRYNYDVASKQYVHLFHTAPCGGTGPSLPTITLVSALKTANNIQMIEQIVEPINDGKVQDLKIRHVFKYANGKYFYDYSEVDSLKVM